LAVVDGRASSLRRQSAAPVNDLADPRFARQPSRWEALALVLALTTLYCLLFGPLGRLGHGEIRVLALLLAGVIGWLLGLPGGPVAGMGLLLLSGVLLVAADNLPAATAGLMLLPSGVA